jgi:glycine/D-amino acid oxidase-like deaminating enzyme
VATGLSAPGRLEQAGPYRRLSLWWDTLPGPVERRPRLDGDVDVDVAIVGAGFTGLWTAHALLQADPRLRVAVLEREVAGYGASGRNGGWCTAAFPASDARIARFAGTQAVRPLHRALQDTVDEVGRAAGAEGIDCHFAKGGTIRAACTPAQRARALASLGAARERGVPEEDLRWLGPDEATQLLGAPGVLGATFSPHCAAVDPGRLVRGLAMAVERRGARICEGTPVHAIDVRPAGRPVLRTPDASVRADVVVRALEGWTATLAGTRRAIAPVYSLMIATEPLPASFWSGGALAERQTFADHRHVVVYGQRTHDGRIAFGGRGAPYHAGSRIRPGFDRVERVFSALRDALWAFFPQLASARITHAWGGPLGVPRDWFPSVGYDRERGVGWAGGYVGDGVAASNLAGRTLADLILGNPSELTRLAWVNRRQRSWEPEPFRWLGVNAGLVAARLADRVETRGVEVSRLGRQLRRRLNG